MDSLYIFDILATVTFGVTGVLVANKIKINSFGSFVLATVTGIGGGTLRDLLLGVQPFWITDVKYIYALIAATIITKLWIKFLKISQLGLVITDTFALGFAAMVGTEKAISLGVHPINSILMGVMTGVCGGIIRDTLSDVRPAAFDYQNLYATAAFSSSLITVILPAKAIEGGIIGGWVVSLLGFRFALIRFLPLLTRMLPILSAAMIKLWETRIGKKKIN